MSSMIRRRLDRMRSDESGFTLVELVVAMFVTLLVMSSMLGIVVESLSSLAKSKQRQAATALANAAMEQLRALPYDTLTVPTLPSVAAGDPNLNYSSTPPLLIIAVTPPEPLIMNSYSPKTTSKAVDGVTYSVTSYVSQPAGVAYFNLTTFVTYSSAASHGTQSLVQHSTAFSPSGCLSTATHPFSGPCQTYFTLQAGLADSGITITKVDTLPAYPNAIPNISPLNDVSELDLGLPGLSTNVLLEQTTSGKGTAISSDGRIAHVGAAAELQPIGTSPNASVDTDPSTSLQPSAGPYTSCPSAIALSTTGAGGDNLIDTPFGNMSCSIAASTAAPSTLCLGAGMGTPLNTGATVANYRPCVSGFVQPQSAGAVTYNAGSPYGFGGVTFKPVDMAAWTTPARAVAAQLTTANATACTVGTGPDATGCGHAHSSRTIPSAVFGSVPPTTDPQWCTLTPSTCTPSAGLHTSGDWSVTNLAEDAYAETGTGARPQLYSRAGVLKYWCPACALPALSPGATSLAGYILVPLSNTLAQTYDSTPITTTYSRPTGTLTFTVFSKITVTAPTVTVYNSSTCSTTGCSAAVSSTAGIVGQTTYKIWFTNAGGVTTELTSFAVVANLGGLVAQSSMKVAS